jgi:HEAT repeat protein
MEPVEDLKLVKEILQGLPRARRIIKTYPNNNPVYLGTIGDVYGKFERLFSVREEIALVITRNEIFFDSVEVCRSEGGELDLPFLFFRDGIMEIRFRRDLTRSELEEFLEIIAVDLAPDDPDDDLVTLLWERDFENIRYFVDESLLMEEGDYQKEAIERVKTKMPGIEQALKTHGTSIAYVDPGTIPAADIGEDDLGALLVDVDRSRASHHVQKLAEILLEMVRYGHGGDNPEELQSFFKDLLIYQLRQGDFGAFMDIGTMIRQAGDGSDGSEALRIACSRLTGLFGSPDVVAQIGTVLDNAKELSNDILMDYVALLSAEAVDPLVSLMGDLSSIQGRKRVIMMLSSLGRTNLQALARALRDPRWYVVRNIVHILRQIASPHAVEYLMQGLRHEEPRVRREAIRALGELKNPSTLTVLKGSLQDPDPANRAHAVRALGDFGSDDAKKILLHEIGSRGFDEQGFDQRKEFFQALSRWKDREVLEVMMRILRGRSLFRWGRVEENKALAAYALGLMGQREALPILRELKGTSSRVLREYAEQAIRTIEHGG